jgi:hypothetical protein
MCLSFLTTALINDLLTALWNQAEKACFSIPTQNQAFRGDKCSPADFTE